MKRFALAGVFSVLPTPFTDDGALDEDGVERIVAAHVATGVTGLTVLGVMGEADEQSEEERGRVLEAVLRTREALPVILGVTGPEASVVARRAQGAAAAGVDAVMVSPTRTLDLPDAVAAAATGGLPVVIQDYPAGSGVPLSIAEIVAVARSVDLVAGVKAEAPPTASAIRELRSSMPGLPALGGLGGLFLIDELRAGATGTLTGFPLPGALERIVRTFPDDPAGAEAEWTALLPLMRFEAFTPLNLAMRKEVWRMRGIIGSARCRRAGVALDDHAREDVRRALEQVGSSGEGSARSRNKARASG